MLDRSRAHKSYPAFEAYMDADPIPMPGLTASGYVAAGTVLCVLLGAFGLVRWVSHPDLWALLMGIGLVAGGLVAFFKMRDWAKSQDTTAKLRRFSAWQALHSMHGLHSSRKLHKRLDPVALQLLETGAFYWAQVRAVLNSSEWSSRQLPQHWKDVRAQAKRAADQAMEDLVLLANRCVGEPQRRKEDDLKGVFRDFVDLDIADALMGLKQMANADWTAYAHRSPMMDAVFPTGRETVEKLRSLAQELEARAPELAGLSPDTAGQSIDAVLNELRAVKRAEDELEEGQIQQGQR